MGTKIQLVVTQEQPILNIITGFYMTAVMNIVSWNKAYSIFAHDTLLQNRTYMMKPSDDYFEKLLRKYSLRGWDRADILQREEHSCNTSIQPFRRVGDRHTWTIPLPVHNVRQSKQPDLFLEYCCFELLPQPYSPGHTHYSVSGRPFQHVTLEYCIVAPQMRFGSWSKFLAERLHAAAKQQLLSMPPGERPWWFAGTSEHAIAHLDSWHFYGYLHQSAEWEGSKHVKHEIPQWFDQWFSGLDVKLLEFEDFSENR